MTLTRNPVMFVTEVGAALVLALLNFLPALSLGPLAEGLL
ncbi:potassium-transporting ATPase subunit KdpA [Streptomyces arenae]|nr:potassium-transporting ATPase subunit KdpA [Streptomyces arenae]MCG7207251.1 potassium-transporting ATPase subunit KdpA [Streptomyces arenae]